MKIDRAETLRYLGFRGQELSEADERNLARAEEICLSAISPKSVVKKYGFACKTMSVEGTNVVFRGNAVRRHLVGCDAVYLVAATLGLNFDRTAARLMREEPAVGVMADAAAVSAIESYLDDLTAEIAEREQGRITRRFSCGYADFPLEQQTDFVRLLDMNKRLGVYLGADFLMTPQKTVTAVIGVRAEAENGL